MAIFIAVDDLKYLRRGGRISSGAADETTQRWVQDIKEAFPGHEVMCNYLSLELLVIQDQGHWVLDFHVDRKILLIVMIKQEC